MPQPSANMPPGDARSGPAKSDRLLKAGLWLAAAALGGLVWSLAGMWIDRSGGASAAQHNAMALGQFWTLSAAGWVGLTMTWVALRRGASKSRSRDRRAILIVLGVAIAARVAVLATHDPALSDDVYRYVFDGRNLAHGFNPYLTDPDDRIAALASGAAENWEGERDILALLAFPEVTTPYLPVSQHVFALMGAACERGGWTKPRESARAFRAGFVAIEMAMLLLILAVLRRHAFSPWWLALYAWHPLAIDGFAASGHQDVIGIAVMVAAMTVLPSPSLLVRGRGAGGEGANEGKASSQSRRGQPSPQPSPEGRGSVRVIVASVPLAMAVMVKPIAALAGLFALRNRPWHNWLIMAIVGVAVCAALALPLHWRPNQPAFVAWKSTADWMAEKAAHFGGVYEPVLCVVRHAMPDGPDRVPGFNLEQEWLARKICMGVLAFALLMILIFVRGAWRATAAAMFALVLCSTTCHPWYLLWGLALFPIARGGWGAGLWVYSLTISLGYVVFISGKGHALGVEWTTQPWALAVAYIPVGIALVADVAAWQRRAEPAAANL